jgi:hypothetical protein
MSSRNLLFVALEPVSDDTVRRAIETRQEVTDVSVLVVAPAAGVGPLQWLTGAEDEARAEAAEVADRTARAVDAEVQTEVGDRDPLLAVEDALGEFPADEIVLAGPADVEMEAALRRFGLPVARLDGGGEAQGHGAETLARDVTQGRSARTPIVLFAAVGAVVIGSIVLVTLIAFLVFWLV